MPEDRFVDVGMSRRALVRAVLPDFEFLRVESFGPRPASDHFGRVPLLPSRSRPVEVLILLLGVLQLIEISRHGMTKTRREGLPDDRVVLQGCRLVALVKALVGRPAVQSLRSDAKICGRAI